MLPATAKAMPHITFTCNLLLFPTHYYIPPFLFSLLHPCPLVPPNTQHSTLSLFKIHIQFNGIMVINLHSGGQTIFRLLLKPPFLPPTNWRQTMTPKTNTLTNLRTRTKRSLPDSRRRFHRRHCSAVRAPNPHQYGETTSSSPCSSSDDDDVSAKLEALQSLIPAQSAEARQTEQLFKETADYIVLLKTQVLILQKLVDFFGSAVLS